MDLKTLCDTPPWDWPERAGATFLSVIRDRQASEADRLLAVQLAGDYTVVNDEIVQAILGIVESSKESEKLRGQAAIAFGPALDHAATAEFDDDDDAPITPPVLRKVQDSLRSLFEDAEVPKYVRRRVLEASVRAPEDWHSDAVRSAYAHDDPSWKLTAVFCMRFIRGFDEQILEALEDPDADVKHEAVCAAGAWSVAAAWSRVAAVVKMEPPKPLLLAAIEAAASIRPQEALELLGPLTDVKDDDIADAAQEAIALAGGASLDDEDDWDMDE